MKNIVFFLLLLPVVFVFAVCTGVVLANIHWLFDLLAQFLLPSFLLALIAGLVALVLRRKWLTVAGGVAALSAFALLWPWTQAPTLPAAGAARVSILSFNVWVRNGSTDELAAAIQAVDADVVVLLEMTAATREKLRPLDAHYPQRFECWQTAGCDILVFSRLPIKEPHIDFTGPPDHSPIAWFETNAAGCVLNIFATHMTRPFPHLPAWSQSKQADDLASAVSGWPGPKLLVGDFNAVPWGHGVKIVAERANLHVSLGSGGTWPSILPPQLRLPIDHVMATEGIAFASRKVLALPGSDHAAVLTEIALEDRTRCW